MDPDSISKKFGSALKERGYRGDLSILMIGDKTTTLPWIELIELKDEYERAGIRFSFIPEEGKLVNLDFIFNLPNL